MNFLVPRSLLIAVILSTSMSFTAWSQDELSITDSSELLSAIEDYRFSDYDIAISKLEGLRRSNPDNLRVLQYLGLSYEESEDFSKALSVYRSWLHKSDKPYAASARFAHIGIANVLLHDKDYSAAARQLKIWLTGQPGDLSAQLLYGDVLIKTNSLGAAASVWQGVLANSEASSEDQAAAHYYLAWIAYKQGQQDQARERARLSLEADAGGAYAGPARELLEMKEERRYAATVSLGAFYTDNVELLPDYVPSSSGKENSDVATQAGLGFSYSFPAVQLSYHYSGSAYAKRTDFNTGSHSLSASWRKAEWSVVPHYENVQLADSDLYDGAGVDVIWGYQNWSVAYGVMYKRFSKSFSTDASLPPTNLERLGGLTNSLTLSRQGEDSDVSHSFAVGVIDEATKRDATHDKTDSYQQLFVSGSLSRRFGLFDGGASVNAYVRNYGKADVQAGGLKREDQYVQLSGFVTWKPWENAHQLEFNASWQQNSSNFNESNGLLNLAKEYSAWRAGLGWSYKW